MRRTFAPTPEASHMVKSRTGDFFLGSPPPLDGSQCIKDSSCLREAALRVFSFEAYKTSWRWQVRDSSLFFFTPVAFDDRRIFSFPSFFCEDFTTRVFRFCCHFWEVLASLP